MSSLPTIIIYIAIVVQKCIAAPPNNYTTGTGPNGEDKWQSTTRFQPRSVGTSFGTIKIGQKMVVEFQIYFRKRMNNPTNGAREQFFRIGHGGTDGGCDNSTHYPSLWLAANDGTDEGMLEVSVTSGSQCELSRVMTGYGNIPMTVWVSCVLTIDHYNIQFDIGDSFTETWSRSHLTDKNHIGQEVPVWWIGDIETGTDPQVGNAYFKTMKITSSVFTYAPTEAPTSVTTAPTLTPSTSPTSATSSPTAAPSASPTTSPSNTPSASPTAAPSTAPTANPSASSNTPSTAPTRNPTAAPSDATAMPSSTPIIAPTQYPSTPPSSLPTAVTLTPTQSPTGTEPTTATPTDTPTLVPSHNPTAPPSANPSSFPTDSPSNYPTATPSKTPSFTPTRVPTIEPTNNPSISPTNPPSAVPSSSPSTSEPSRTPSSDPTVSPSKHPTVSPSLIPTSTPSQSPTSHPSAHPTTTPTIHPSHSPSLNPTSRPSQSPVAPGDPTHAPSLSTSTPTHSPSMEPTSGPTTEPTVNPTITPSKHPTVPPSLNPIATTTPSQSPSLDPSAHPTSSPTIDPSHSPSRNPTLAPSQSPNAPLAPTNIPTVNPSNNPTESPSNYPTIAPTDHPTIEPTVEPTTVPTKAPSVNPSVAPTVPPTTSHPTAPNEATFNVSFAGNAIPFSVRTFLGDPYGRFQSSIDIIVVDKENTLEVSALCTQCFIWQYREENGVWKDIGHLDDDDISVYNKQVTQNDISTITTYQSTLTVQSIRRLNAGRCFDESAAANARIFQPGHRYEIRFTFHANDASIVSNVLSIETNTLPSGGFCVVQNIEELAPLEPYHLYCDGFVHDNNADLEYNAMINDVLLSKSTFVNNAMALESIAPSAGNISIIVLVKEKNISSAITCYPIHAVFKGILDTNASNIDGLLQDVSSLTNSTSFAENPSVAIAIYSVIEDIFAQNLTTKEKATEIMGEIIGNIMNGVGTSSDDIISGLSTLAALTSNAQIVALDTTADLVENFISGVFDAVDAFSDGYDGDVAIQDIYYIVAERSQDLIDNLEHTLQEELGSFGENITNGTVSDEVIDSMNDLAQSLVEYATMGASKALLESNVGESFNYDKITYDEDGNIVHTKSIIATKFDANIIDYNDSSIDVNNIELPKCGKKEQNIQLPLAFMQQQDGEFDCALVASSMNNFITTKKRAQASDTVSIDLFAGKRGNRRRRLIEFESNACFPYLISMSLTDPSAAYNSYKNVSLGEASAFPSCDFWNTGSTFWDTSGCFVYSLLDASVTCGCTHLTTFSLSDDSILPEANIMSMIEWNHFTIHNLIKYPTVWLTCFLIFALFLIICYFDPYSDRVHSRSILAFEDIIYKSYQQRILYQDTVGKEIKYISDYMPNKHFVGMGIKMIASDKNSQKSICVLQWKLFLAYLGNEHTFLSVFQRSAGTNFSVRQRLGCFFMYLANIMMVTGTFYGLEQSSTAQDIAASFIISLSGTIPVTIVKTFFLKSKPNVVKSTKHYFADLEDRAKKSKKNKKSKRTAVSSSEQWENFDMAKFLKEAKKKHMTMNEFTKKLGKYYDVNNKEHRIRAMTEIRQILFNKTFPLRYEWKKVGWVVLILWSMGACAIAIMYGLAFDIHATEGDNPHNPNHDLYQSDCWNTTLSLQVESRLSKEKFLSDYAEQQMKNASSYGGSDSISWLLTIFNSLFQSMLLWQPLTAYVTTWIKVWLFTWHLKMELGPKTMWRLCKNCCRTSNDDEGNADFSRGHSLRTGNVNSYQPSSVVSHDDRPFDLISFLGNATWVIDDVEEEDYNIYGTDEGDDDCDGEITAKEMELQTMPKQNIIMKLMSLKSHSKTASNANAEGNSLIFSLVDDMIEEQQDEKEESERTIDLDIDLEALVDDLMSTEQQKERNDIQHTAKESAMEIEFEIDDFVDAVFSENELEISEVDGDDQES